MKKEILVAIFVGLFIGLIITFGIYRAKTAIRTNNFNKIVAPTEEITADSQQPLAPTTGPTKKPAVPLIITTPKDNSISTQDEIELSGKTTPEAVVIILYEEGEQILLADKDGNFNTELSLVSGANTLDITVYEMDGSSVSKQLDIVYSHAKI